jgi:hypothetical protein
MRRERRANQLEWLRRRLRLELRRSITVASQIQHLASRGLTAIGPLPPNAGLDSPVGVNQSRSGHGILRLLIRYERNPDSTVVSHDGPKIAGVRLRAAKYFAA